MDPFFQFQTQVKGPCSKQGMIMAYGDVWYSVIPNVCDMFISDCSAVIGLYMWYCT